MFCTAVAFSAFFYRRIEIITKFEESVFKNLNVRWEWFDRVYS